jgi:phage terminase small subunit
MADKLTEKQKRFADEYLVDLNATKAYMKVYGCKEPTAMVNASRTLSNAKVSEYIQNKQERLTAKVEWTIEDILKGIKAIANDPDAKRFEKLKALELGGKHLGMFTERIESHNINENIEYSDEERQKRLAELLEKRRK